MNNNTVFHYNSYTRIHFKCDFNGINAYSESWVNSVFLSYAYFFIYLWLITTVVYCIIVSSGSVNIPYWEILLQKIIAAIGVPFVMTCFFCELAWILFHKQELTISSFEINYKLTVIFPIIRHKIPINTVTNISIIQDKYGFGIVFSTKNKPIKIFHFRRYKRSRNPIKDKSFYKNEISELMVITHSIDSFLKQQKEKHKDT